MAITTTYDGIEYRSRLEARWAAFMKNVGWDIVYEPFDGDGYIPDFLVQGPNPMLVEVKPAVTLTEYQAAVPKAEKGLAAHWSHDILIVGASPFPTALCRAPCHVLDEKCTACREDTAGLLGEYTGDYGGDFDGWDWDSGTWGDTCGCGGVGVFHSTQSYRGRPCGCYDGGWIPPLISRPLLESFWADACNDVKWRGRAA